MRSEGMRVGIIGGYGGMGSLFAGIFARSGHEVLRSGRNTALSNTDLAAGCDLVMVSVPIRSTVAVIREIAPLLREDQVLCDLTSLKAAPVEAMLASRAEVIGLHPMFGPGVRSLQGQTIVATPSRCGDETLDLLLSIFRHEGARITITTPRHHDEVMAVVQGLAHFSTLSIAEAMRRLGADPLEMLAFTSPVYRIEMDLVGRILGQDAGLYGDILQCNPCVPDVLSAFAAAVASLKENVESRDPERFEAFFRDNRERFDSYIPQATAESEAIIEALVMR
ncbi:MAG: prephenate dehydrogenase/arogenate dehydrogenase family protein [Methanomicrobiaceae archaeon]|nr:prephenate dehydrogenase/arogenate dehydrogenase family protein [Methanomicrobiaceae archaeon]